MCAAPGSKTQQLLEALHSGRGGSGSPLPPGFVVANDADHKRCNLLTHQTKRVCSPCLLVTNHAGEQFPEVKRTGTDGQVSGPRRTRGVGYLEILHIYWDVVQTVQSKW